MRLKSTNIWDDVRKTKVEEESSARHGRYRGARTSVRSGSSPEDRTDSRSSHANRHGVSMKSLMKNRRG